MNISVVILTFNEEKNLPDCLASVNWSDDIVIFDSFSTDNTLAIAQQAGVRIFQRTFDGYASQRNAALAVDYKYKWVLMLDADERLTPEVLTELQQKLNQPQNEVTLYRMRRKDMFMGRWIKRSSGYPTWFARVMQPSRVRVEREINEEYLTDGQTAFLDSHLIHYPFNKGIEYWVTRHNRYSTMEAAALSQEKTQKIAFAQLLRGNPIEKRKQLKQLAYRLPFRPLFVFFYLFMIRLGLLDGIPGFFYAVLRTIYEVLINLKMIENEYRTRGESL